MARETTKWPSTRWPITKIMSSDGCKGNRIPLEMGPWYHFHEFGCHLGNVGLIEILATLLAARMDMPSTRISRICARLKFDSLFMPLI